MQPIYWMVDSLRGVKYTYPVYSIHQEIKIGVKKPIWNSDYHAFHFSSYPILSNPIQSYPIFSILSILSYPSYPSYLQYINISYCLYKVYIMYCGEPKTARDELQPGKCIRLKSISLFLNTSFIYVAFWLLSIYANINLSFLMLRVSVNSRVGYYTVHTRRIVSFINPS